VVSGSFTHYYFLLSVGAVVAWLPSIRAPACARRAAARAVAAGLVPFLAWTPLLAR